MRRVKYQCNVSHEAIRTKTVKVVDGFMKDDLSDRSYPAKVAIMSISRNACLVEASVLSTRVWC